MTIYYSPFVFKVVRTGNRILIVYFLIPPNFYFFSNNIECFIIIIILFWKKKKKLKKRKKKNMIIISFRWWRKGKNKNCWLVFVVVVVQIQFVVASAFIDNFKWNKIISTNEIRIFQIRIHFDWLKWLKIEILFKKIHQNYKYISKYRNNIFLLRSQWKYDKNKENFFFFFLLYYCWKQSSQEAALCFILNFFFLLLLLLWETIDY